MGDNLEVIHHLTEEIVACNEHELRDMLLYLAVRIPEEVRDALAYSAAQLAVELERDELASSDERTMAGRWSEFDLPRRD